MLSKIERIAVLLIKLQKAGLVDYTHFYLECGCCKYEKTQFDEVISSMKCKLDEWQKTLEKYRKQYPHLNYYTSQQLLDLQIELGKLKKDPQFIVSDKLKQLLLSVNPDPNQSKISIAIKNAVLKEDTSSTSDVHVSESSLHPSKLTNEQKDIFSTLTIDDGYADLLVLSAFLELETDANERTLREWCAKNEHKYEDCVPDSALPIMNNSQDKFSVSQDDPSVLKLIDEEYSEEIAIKAVTQARGDMQLAREIALSCSAGKTYRSNTLNEPEW